ncbi:hypothetical protein ACHHYP_00528 [Achlya hypogyna]|uniref:Uncharacterized protein n=1 Tax=Achlya hypogyna TaxID=1202772 RepID=A0A1V9ZUE7_ACHHY|nr:hypothetical protein ACHHYP_00528 [Achlya hypogyna]
MSYEEDRAARIARNKAMLQALGIDKKVVSPKKRAVVAKKPTGPPRRSRRVEMVEAARAKAELQARYEQAALEKNLASENSRSYRRKVQEAAQLKHELEHFDETFMPGTARKPYVFAHSDSEGEGKKAKTPKAKARRRKPSWSSDEDEDDDDDDEVDDDGEEKLVAVYTRQPRRTKFKVMSLVAPSSDSEVEVIESAPRHSSRSSDDDVQVYIPNKRQRLAVSEDLIKDIPVLEMTQAPKGPAKSIKEVPMTVPSTDHVGYALTPLGKQPAIFWLCPGHLPRFSLMNGHQFLANGMVLFMNIDANNYDNVFLKHPTTGAVTVSWFARKSIDESHEVAQHLIHGVQADAESSLQQHELPTLLFFRFHAGGAYIYGGQLAYVRHKGSNPIRFEFQLLDAKHMSDELLAIMLRADE